MNWGTRIALSFVAFAAIIFFMVFVSMNQDINLVAEDYYKQEIAYEDQISRLKNTRALEETPTITLDQETGLVSIGFPINLSQDVKEGSIHLFRPSDASQDFSFALVLDSEGHQQISMKGKSRGLWKLKLTWSGATKEFYDEKTLNY